eukprot:2098184-Rhodomonas_salina.3
MTRSLRANKSLPGLSLLSTSSESACAAQAAPATSPQPEGLRVRLGSLGAPVTVTVDCGLLDCECGPGLGRSS